MPRNTSDHVLPPPATLSNGATVSANKHTLLTERSVRIKSPFFPTLWQNFKRRIASPSSVVSESVLDDSQAANSDYSPHRAPVTLALNRNPSKRSKPLSDQNGDSRQPIDHPTVEVVVVENSFASYSTAKSSSASEHGASLDKTASHKEGTIHTDGIADSVYNKTSGLWYPWITLRYRAWPVLLDFFDPKFADPKAELNYTKELWQSQKLVAFFSSLFWVANWVLGIAIVPKPLQLPDEIFYYGLSPMLSAPMPFLVYFDWPRKHNILYQVFLGFSTWSWAIYQLFFLFFCGLYNPSQAHISCVGRDFLAIFYYCTALQTIAIFGLRMNRISALMGGTIFIGLFCALAVSNKHTLIRTTLNFLVFQLFLIYLHWSRETQDRRLFDVRRQLNIQYLATQKAQVSEKKVAESKRRLTSYIFHEVRVPLNTALLAVQNMTAAGMLKDCDIELTALEGSLNMMSKVLNDVLDFNRMETGKFESVNKPFSLHRAIRSMLGPLRMAADAKDLELEVELDKDIDVTSRTLYYKAQGMPENEVNARLESDTAEEGMVVGDEMRLRQVITNFASNASKFTPSGGKISLTTKLLHPTSQAEIKAASAPSTPLPTPSIAPSELSFHQVQLHNTTCSPPANTEPPDYIVVRIEISDTGLGIKPEDLTDNKLFSAYVQTDLGRSQGGKGKISIHIGCEHCWIHMAGTGLGLALIRHIVALSKGRLGVSSSLGKGSTFWIELAFGVGKRALAAKMQEEREGFANFTQSGFVRRSGNNSPDSRGRLARNASDKTSPSIVDDTSLKNGILSSPLRYGSSAFTTILEHDGFGLVETPKHGSPSMLTPATTPIPDSSTTANSQSSAHAKPSFVQLPPRAPFHKIPPSPTSTSSNPVTPANLGLFGLTSESSLHLDSPLTVLCVDDDALTRTLMKKMLTRLGCSVQTASDGQQALELIMASTPADPTPGPRRSKFDIIFLDNQMPILSGVTLTARLRQLGCTDLIVGVTGNAMTSDVEEYKDAGADHVLTKPVMEPRLRAMLVLARDRFKPKDESFSKEMVT